MPEPTLSDIHAMVEKLEAISQKPDSVLAADDGLRRRFREAAKKASIAAEVPGDTIHRLSNTALQIYMARLGTKVKIFEVLSGTNKPMSSIDLASATGVTPRLMKRLLRYYQSFQMVAEVGIDQFLPSNVTKALTGPISSGIDYFADMINPSYSALPEWMEKNGYDSTEDIKNVPFDLGHSTTEGPFAYLQNNPDKLGTFMVWMTQQRFGLPIWLDAFPFEEKVARQSTSDTVLFVDVGGAAGHQCIALRDRFPNTPGRVILQDTPATIGQVTQAGLQHGIEAMAHDFFTPQPVKGARVYYMRNIMHDWPDDKCITILRSLTSAMSLESVIMIDEMVLPEAGTPWRATQLDIAMLTCLAAKERSKNEWDLLIKSAGLQVVDTYQYTEECADCVIVCKPLAM